eukprot:TRINITY_DN9988_c0_g1_i3.p1 TRINITY_DN9988_c0_g1~~TRINITY_DN9988_c0_g1_i3.p1  ORF type:complete len:433 (+),score=70.24 TRINITY_DN9988_c0_g1_i3:134-1432(+)
MITQMRTASLKPLTTQRRLYSGLAQRKIPEWRVKGIDVTRSQLLVPGPAYEKVKIQKDDKIDWKEVGDADRGKKVLTLVKEITGYPEDVIVPLFKRDLISFCTKQGRWTKGAPALKEVEPGDIIGIPKMLPDYLWKRLQGETTPSYKPSLEEVKLVRSWVAFKNEDCIVLNKPPGVACAPHKGSGLTIHDLLDGLKYSMKNRPFFMNKLEKDMSGCVVLARTESARRHLKKYLRVPRVPSFCFWAVVTSKPKIRRARVEMNLEMISGPSGDRVTVRLEPTPSSHQSKLEYNVVSDEGRHKDAPSWVSFYPLTGKRNEIRIASSMVLHTPILGDVKYGGDAALPTAQLSMIMGRSKHQLPMMLHCAQVSLPYEDKKGQRVVIQVPLPPHMQSFWTIMNWDQNYPDPYIMGIDASPQKVMGSDQAYNDRFFHAT